MPGIHESPQHADSQHAGLHTSPYTLPQKCANMRIKEHRPGLKASVAHQPSAGGPLPNQPINSDRDACTCKSDLCISRQLIVCACLAMSCSTKADNVVSKSLAENVTPCYRVLRQHQLLAQSTSRCCRFDARYCLTSCGLPQITERNFLAEVEFSALGCCFITSLKAPTATAGRRCGLKLTCCYMQRHSYIFSS